MLIFIDKELINNNYIIDYSRNMMHRCVSYRIIFIHLNIFDYNGITPCVERTKMT